MLQPREKLTARGPEALDDAELLAILLGTGTAGKPVVTLAREVLSTCGGFAGIHNTGASALRSVKGIGAAKTTTLLATFEIARRAARQRNEERAQFASPDEAGTYFAALIGSLPIEEVHAVFLDTHKKLIRSEMVARGSSHQAAFHPAQVLRVGLLCGADAVILGHNHPSGHTRPSPSDFAITQRLVDAGRVVGMELLDHIVVAGAEWLSIRECSPDLFHKAQVPA